MANAKAQVKVGVQVCINDLAKGHQLLDGFEGRYGIVSHLVAGEGLHSDEDTLWVVAIARSSYERKLLFSNATNSIDENTCSWMPVPQSFLDIVDSKEIDSNNISHINKKRRMENMDNVPLSHIPNITHQVRTDYNQRKEQEESINQLDGDIHAKKLPSVCVIVCFRDLHSEQKRGEHLAKFVPHMNTFFNKAIKNGLCQRYRYIYFIMRNM